MPQLDFNFYCAQIFWLFVSFGLLFVAMKFWLLPPLIDILNRREEKIKHILRQADKLSAQAERIQKKYQQYIDGAHQYSVRILQTAHDEIEDAYEKQEKQLQTELNADLLNAQEQLDAEKNIIYSKLETITSDFIQILLKVCYRLKPASSVVKKEVSVHLKGKKNA